MSDVERYEYYLEEPLLPKLFLQSWRKAGGGGRGLVLITHGMCEHSECYSHLATSLAEKDWTVFAWDLEGHGKSAGKRGYVENFMDFVRDLGVVIEEIKKNKTIKSTPLVLFGHSMGGLITLRYLMQKDQAKIAACVLSSPSLGIAMEVPAIKEMAANWLNKFWPSLTMSSEIVFADLSRDQEIIRSYDKDPLRHGKISAPIFLGMKESMLFVKNNVERLKVPVFFQVAGNDKVVDAKETIAFYKEVLAPKSIQIYEDDFHEIYNELDRQQVIDDLHTYLASLGL